MLGIVEFIKFIPTGTSKAFLGLCNDNRKWIIRLKESGKNSRRLLSQFVVCKLAKLIGISCPEVSLINININSKSSLTIKLSQFDQKSNVGVGNIYMDNLKRFPLPENYNIINKNERDFKKANYIHLKNIITNEKQLSQLYGIHIFSHWIILHDFRKYEDLWLVDDKIIFLDFDVALSDGIGSFSIPPSYNSADMQNINIEFLKGLKETEKDYQFWIQKILSISESEFEKIFSLIPDFWGVPKDYIDSLKELLIDNREHFIEQFLLGMNYRLNYNN